MASRPDHPAHPAHPFPLESGGLRLFPRAFAPGFCREWMADLIGQLAWHRDFHEVAGRRFHIPRLQAWAADDGLRYSYSDNLLETQAWTPNLSRIRHEVEALVGHAFNSVLVTYYRNGDDHVTWHADDERELGDQPVIASLSLGARRRFEWRSRLDGQAGGMDLEEGDVLLMLPAFQHEWLHRVPAQPEVAEGRINLTFRRVVDTGIPVPAAAFAQH